MFQDRGQALQTLKLLTGSQLKRFTSRDEADEYSRSRMPDVTNVVKEDTAEKSTVAAFKSISTRDLVPFRRAIEKGDTESVKQTVWSNPRYLISSGDTAVILMHGPRYNACHVAARADKAETLKTILQTVSDKKFVQSLYVTDNEATTESRCRVLLDCYLNTPDQGVGLLPVSLCNLISHSSCLCLQFHDTPLHFACKFGSVSCVRVLLSHKECDRTKVNKLAKTAGQVICERKTDSSAKIQIEQLFQQQLYIPVIRTDDCIRVGRPEDLVHLGQEANVQAVAGPLSPPQAQDLFQYLRSPHRTGTSAEVRLSDQSKGVERMARVKCREMGVEWVELWPFLNCNLDLSSPRGLHLLEQHLQDQQAKRLPDHSLDMSDLHRALSNMRVSDKTGDVVCEASDGEEDAVFVTAPSSPVPADVSVEGNQLPECDVFVEGTQFSEWDKNAFLALEHAPIDGAKFPHIAKWHERVSELMKDYSTHVTPLKRNKRYVTPARLAFTP